MTNGRTLTDFAARDPKAVDLLDGLLKSKDDSSSYREHMRLLGEHLAESLVPMLRDGNEENICVVCTVEDADFLARGLIEKIEKDYSKIHLLCMWNERVKSHGVSISPVKKSYVENYNKKDTVFIVVKSIISGSCVVKTNLTKAITETDPKRVFVVAPVMYAKAQENLEKEFPLHISEKFQFVNFAIDSELSEDGSEIIPGIGGSVYELLGLISEEEKNKYMPDLVRDRRRKLFSMA